MRDFALGLTPATQLSSQSLATLVNQVYADYFLPVWMDALQFERICRDEGIDLAHSVVAFADDEPVGLALLSWRERRGWVSGVGVLPLLRRRGIARQLLIYLQNQAQLLGLTSLTLEVLVQNRAGVALYQDLGFVWQRDLLVLTLESRLFDPAPLPASVTQAAPALMLDRYYATFHDVPSPWQREPATLRGRLDLLRGLAFYEDSRCVGYVLYQEQRHHQAIFDLAVLPEYPQRLEVARTLLRAVHGTRHAAGGYAVNIPAEDVLLAAFMRLRYRIWQRLNEMVWHVA